MGCGLSTADKFAAAIILQSDPSQLWNLLSIDREDPRKILIKFLPPEEKKTKIFQDNGSGQKNVILLDSVSPLLACVIVIGDGSGSPSSSHHLANHAIHNPKITAIRTDEIRLQMLKMLVNAGDQVNLNNNNKSVTPLHAACINFFPECVRYLVSQKANFFAAGSGIDNNSNNNNAVAFVCRAHREPQLFYLTNEQQTEALSKIAELIITKEVVEKINLEISKTFDRNNNNNNIAINQNEAFFSLFLSTITIQDFSSGNNNKKGSNLVAHNPMRGLVEIQTETSFNNNNDSNNQIIYGPALTAASRQFIKHGIDLNFYAALLGNGSCPLWPEIQRLAHFNSSFMQPQQETSASCLSEVEKKALVKFVVTSAMGLITRESGIFNNASDNSNADFSNSLSQQNEALCYHLETEIDKIGSASFLVGVRHVKGSLVELLRGKITAYIFAAVLKRNNNNAIGNGNNNNNNLGNATFFLSDESKKSFAFEMRREVETFLKTFNVRVQLIVVRDHHHADESEAAATARVVYENIGNDIARQMAN